MFPPLFLPSSQAMCHEGSCDSAIQCVSIHLGVNNGPHTHTGTHTGASLQGPLNMRSVRLSVSGQGIGTRYMCIDTLTVCKSLWSGAATGMSEARQKYSCALGPAYIPL